MANRKLIFLMGLPASGKTTLGKLLASRISDRSISVIHLDADTLIKHEISPKLGDFSLSGRLERAKFMIRLIKWAKEQFSCIIVSASGQPDLAQKMLFETFPHIQFIHLKGSHSELRRRDYKGIYKHANVLGKDLEFTIPDKVFLELDTTTLSEEDCIEIILDRI